MITPYQVAGIIGLLLATIIAFIVGWNMAVWRWRHRNEELAVQYDDLAAEWQKLADALERDPVRMGLNTGQEFIIREMEAFCARHRQRLEEYVP